MKNELAVIQTIQDGIIELPGRPKFMLAQMLAEIYQVPVRQINQAVKRNPKRFPEDFCFSLTDVEAGKIRSQNVIKIYAGSEKRLMAFTREGANQLSTVLKSDVAAERSVQIIRAFSAMEEKAHREYERELRRQQQQAKIDWQANRQIVREQRRETTDAIVALIEYAREQGSKSPDRVFYMSYSKMVNYALFMLSKAPKNFRDMLSIKQLQILSVAESLVEEMIHEEIAKGTPYKGPKGIYEIVKARITKYAETVGRIPLLEEGNKMSISVK